MSESRPTGCEASPIDVTAARDGTAHAMATVNIVNIQLERPSAAKR